MITKDDIDIEKLAEAIVDDNIGISARTIIAGLFGIDHKRDCAPCDSEDVWRCVHLCEILEIENIDFMKGYEGNDADVWQDLADNWERVKQWVKEENDEAIDDFLERIK